MNRLYFIDNKYLGKSKVPKELEWEESVFWYCWKCGEVYARFPVEDQPWQGYPPHWRAWEGCCRACPPCAIKMCNMPGSVWHWSSFRYNSQYPEEVLKRELLLTIDAYEKGFI